jgi:molybdopterin molybdotransferase
VAVEDTESIGDGSAVRILAAARPGQHIDPRAKYVRAGDVVLAAGTRLDAPQIGVAASAGAAQVSVYPRPTVAVLVTGDELVDVADRPAAAQIRNSNGPVLIALVRQAGAEPRDLGRVGDDLRELTAKIAESAGCDFLCLSGGVSMGRFDLVPRALADCGAEVKFQKMATKPGKPTLFAVMPDGRCVFALPGNPISAFVGFTLLVGPAIEARQGRPPGPLRLLTATLDGRVKPTQDRRSFLPAAATVADDGGIVVTPLRWFGSGDPFGMARANCMIVRPPNSPPADAGQAVSIVLLSGAL